MNDLSICVVSWNVKDLLKNCLRSIAEASGEVDYEVIVVDNASEDGGGRMVKKEFPSVKLIENRQNRGFAAACNQAIGKSSSRFILLLNPDTELRPGGLKEMIDFLKKHPAAGGAGCRLLNPDGSIQPSIRGFPDFRSSLGEFTILGKIGFFRRSRREYLKKDFDYDRPRVVDQPMGAALFFRRAALEEVGFMDEEFFLYFEEVDLCRRLRDRGRPLWYNPAAEIIHRGGASTGRAGARADFWFQKSQLEYFRKHRGKLRTFCFSLIYKPMFLMKMIWGTIENGISLAIALLLKKENIIQKKNRFFRKCRFLTRYTLKFCIL